MAYGKQIENLLVLDWVFSLEEILINGQAGQGSGLSLGDDDCELKLGDEVAGLFNEDGEWDEQFVLKAFLDADSGSDGVFEGVETEAERGVSVEDIVEKLSALLDLEVVWPVECPLVDSASEIALLGLSLSAADQHVKGEHVVDGEFLSIDSLLESFFIDDDLVSIYEVLLELVGQDSFERGNLIGVTDLLDDFGNLIVEVSWLEQSQGGLGGLVGSQNHISLLSGDGSVLIRLHNNSMTDESSETVNVCTQFDLDEVSFLDVDRVLLEWWVVAADFVDRDGGGEGDALEGRLFIIDLREFFVNLAVWPEAQIEDLGANCNLLEESAEHFIDNFGWDLVFFDNSGSAEGFLFFSFVFLHVQQTNMDKLKMSPNIKI